MIIKFKYKYLAEVKSVYDGDGAYDCIIDMGMKMYVDKQVRLFGVDTPELRGKQKEAGRKVRDFVRECILGKKVVLHTQKDKSGKYGRLLANIKFDDNKDLSKLLLKKGYAKKYLGGKKEPWTQKELAFILEN